MPATAEIPVQRVVGADALGRVRGWLGPTIIAVAAGVAVLAQLQRENRTGGWATFWLIVAVVFAVVAACVPFVEKILRARHEVDVEQQLLEATTNQIIVLNDALDPVVEELGRIADRELPDRAAALGQLKSLALTAATKVIPAAKVRAGYFEVRTTPVESVVPVLHAGRAGRNRTTFTAATPAGRAVLKMLKDDDHLLCKDTAKHPPTGWDKRRQRDYQTFINVPVRAGSSLYGMLTVDAPAAGSLSEVDASMMRIIGNLIAVAVSICDTRGAS